MPDVDAIRHAWRTGTSPSLRRRRKLAMLCSLGLADFALISAYQMGLVPRLPDPPGRLFDSKRANESRKAFSLGLPDGPLALVSLSSTWALAAAGGTDRSLRSRVSTWLLLGSTAAGAVASVNYLYDMAKNQQRACPYCIFGATVQFAAFGLAIGEARDALAA